MQAIIVDYGLGNIHSVAKALTRVAGESAPHMLVHVTTDPEIIRGASHIVLPGVGSFAGCRRGLRNLAGAEDALNEAVIERGRPFMGICVGMQLMADHGCENGGHDGLGWILGEVIGIPPGVGRKLPHMGWNDLNVMTPPHPVLDGISSSAYFVHSYHFVPKNPAHVLATADYGIALTAMVGRDNLIGVQFHPEKSQKTGLKLLANFLRWRP